MKTKVANGIVYGITPKDTDRCIARCSPSWDFDPRKGRCSRKKVAGKDYCWQHLKANA